MDPPNYWQLLSKPTLETKPPFCFLLPHSTRRHYRIVCGTVFLVRDILPFQFEQGGTQPILILEHKQYLFES